MLLGCRALDAFPVSVWLWRCLPVSSWIMLRQRRRVSPVGQAGSRRGADPGCGVCVLSSDDLRALPQDANGPGQRPRGRRDSSPADFVHAASGVHYTVTREAGQVWLNYEREDPTHALKGRQELALFPGFGQKGPDLPVRAGGLLVRGAYQLVRQKADMGYDAQLPDCAGDAVDASRRSGVSPLPRVGGGAVAAGCTQPLRGRAVRIGRNHVRRLPRGRQRSSGLPGQSAHARHRQAGAGAA